MDSKRSFIIAAVLLLCVNILMAVYLIHLTVDDGRHSDNDNYVVELMQYRGVDLLCDIPQYPAPSVQLQLEDPDNLDIVGFLQNKQGEYSLSEDALNISFLPVEDQRYDALTIDQAQSLADVFMQDFPARSGVYELDSIESIGVDAYAFNYIFTQSSYSIYNRSVLIKIGKGGIESVDIQNISYTVLDELPQQNMPVSSILAASFVRVGQAPLSIVKIDAGYIYDKTSDSIKSAWRVVYDANRVRYFSSIDGIEIMQ